MAEPITWRNVAGPDFTGAARMMEGAQRMFSDGFGQFKNIIEQQQVMDQANAVAQRRNNTSSYLDQLQVLGQSPDKLQEAIKSGAVQRLRQSFGSNIDADAVRGAEQNLLAQRYQQVTAANAFADQERDRKEQPILDQIGSLTAQGKLPEAKALLEQYNLRNESKAYAALDERGQLEVTRGRETTRFGWDGERQKWAGEKHRDDLATNAAQRDASRASAENSRKSLTMREKEFNLSQEARITDNIVKLQEALGKTYDRDPNSQQSLQASMEMINKLPEAARDLALRAAAKARATPGATNGSVLATIMASTAPEYLSTDGGQIDRAVKAGEATRLAETASGMAETTAARQGILAERLKQMRAMSSANKGETTTKPAESVANPVDSGKTTAEVNKQATDASVRAEEQLRAAVKKPAASTAERAARIAQEMGPASQKQREADYQAKVAAREANEQAERQRARDILKANTQAAQERAAAYNEKALAAQTARYEAKRADRKQEQAQNVARLRAELRMLESRPGVLARNQARDIRDELEALLAK